MRSYLYEGPLTMPSYEFQCIRCHRECHYQNDYTTDKAMAIVCNECTDRRFTDIIAAQDRPCRFCGHAQLHDESSTVFRRMAVEMLSWECCTKCHHFLHCLAKYRGKYPAVIVNGEHRIDGGNALGAKASHLGYGGDVWRFRLLNDPDVTRTLGEVISSNNLWNQGTIPDCLRSLLPDNAEFIHDEQKV